MELVLRQVTQAEDRQTWPVRDQEPPAEAGGGHRRGVRGRGVPPTHVLRAQNLAWDYRALVASLSKVENQLGVTGRLLNFFWQE